MKSRYIKQDLDKKGRIKKSSYLVGMWPGTNYPLLEGYLREANGELLKHIRIRNVIIVILIALLIMWR